MAERWWPPTWATLRHSRRRKTGFVVPRGDDAALVERMATLIADRELCHRMGEAGRLKAEREFGLDRLVSETLAAYRAAGWKDTLTCAALQDGWELCRTMMVSLSVWCKPCTTEDRTPMGSGRGPRATLVHTRLSIIDLSPTGAQPMANEDGTIWTIFNGEIYNHRELRHELEARGHVFRGRSDTEVLPHLYEEEGPAFAAKLRGMFALGDL